MVSNKALMLIKNIYIYILYLQVFKNVYIKSERVPSAVKSKSVLKNCSPVLSCC